MLTVTLSGMTKASFNSTLDTNLRTAIAARVSVTPDKVTLVLTDVTLRRRLLAAGLNISVSITFASQAASASAQTALNKTAFDSFIAATPGLAGVVTVTGVTAPVVVVTTVTNAPGATAPGTTNTTAKLGSAPPRRRAAAALGPLAALAAAWAACAAAGPLTAGG